MAKLVLKYKNNVNALIILIIMKEMELEDIRLRILLENNSINNDIISNIKSFIGINLNDAGSLLVKHIYPKLLSILEKNEGFTFIEVSAPKSVIDLFKCVVIWSPKEVRIKRLLDRGMDEEDITNRINNQPNDEWWYSIGTLIENNKIEDLESKLIHEIQKLL